MGGRVRVIEREHALCDFANLLEHCGAIVGPPVVELYEETVCETCLGIHQTRIEFRRVAQEGQSLSDAFAGVA